MKGTLRYGKKMAVIGFLMKLIIGIENLGMIYGIYTQNLNLNEISDNSKTTWLMIMKIIMKMMNNNGEKKD